jgi:hypothetical protein
VRSRTEQWQAPPPLERVGSPTPAEESETADEAGSTTAEGRPRDPGGGDGPSVA